MLAIDVYGAFMRELKRRLDEIGFRLHVVRQNPNDPNAIFEIESAYLQTRFVCELVALSALAAHSDAGTKKALLRAWNADEIFRQLSKINPHCFPQPVTAQRTKTGWHFSHVEGRHMNRHDLAAVYHQCGKALHRGVLKAALEGRAKAYEPGRVEFWLGEFLRLLRQHVIVIGSVGRAYVVNLDGENGFPEVFVGEAVA